MSSEMPAAAGTAAEDRSGTATAPTPRRSGPPGRRRATSGGPTSSGGGAAKGDRVFSGIAHGAAWFLLVLVSAIAVFLVSKAVGAISADKENWLTSFTWDPDSVTHSAWGIAVFAWGTLITSLFALLFGAPVAIGIALFISHYAPRRLAQVLGYVVDLLAAVPSVVYGLWGVLVLAPHMLGPSQFVSDILGWIPLFHFDGGNLARSMFTAGVVLAIMILPIVTAISREVFLQTPRENIEAAYALGATRWEMVRLSVLPYGRSGVSSAVVLGLGRALGETIAVAMVLSAEPVGALTIVTRFLDPHGQTIAANVANKFGDAGKNGQGALIASGLVLFVITLFVNYLARSIAKRGVAEDGGKRPGFLGRLLGRGADDDAADAPVRTSPAPAPRGAFERADASTGQKPQPSDPAVGAVLRPLAPVGLRRRVVDLVARAAVTLAFVIAVIPLVSIVATVVSKGAERFSWRFLTSDMANVNDQGKGGHFDPKTGKFVNPLHYDGGGISHAIVGTLEMVGLATLIALPVALLVAVYLVEYGRGRLARSVTFMVDVLMGLPSIVAGLFMLSILIATGHDKAGYWAAGALVILMLPMLVRSAEEMLKLVPDALREASYALGIQKWRTIVRVVVPTALPGIVTGVMLGVARVMGETAPVLLVAGGAAALNANPFSGHVQALPAFIFSGAGDSDQFMVQRAWAAALTLILLVMVLNLFARLIAWWKKAGA
jgi:phosphate transport system permease protein